MTEEKKPAFVYVTYIETTPEKVYDALLDGEMTKLFWGRGRNVSDWKAGSSWSQQDYDDAGKVLVTGQVVEADRPRRLVLTWQSTRADAKEEGPSRVSVLIEPAFGAVRLTVTHTDLGPKALGAVGTGWPAILSSLKTLLETGQPMPMTTRSWAPPA